MKKIILLIFALILSAMAYGQEITGGETEYVTIPVNASLLPGVSMSKNAVPEKKIVNNINYNILAGSAEKLRGVELGGLVNYYSEDVMGVQFAGWANIVKDKTVGAQFAGIVNLNVNEFIGAQFAGITNLVPENIKGMQAAGIANIHLGTLEGAQVAGILNITDTVKTGFQIGLLNFANENNGIPLGLVSYVKKDGLRMDVWGDEATFTNAGLRSGTRRFHNILFFGKQVTDPLSWTAGYGFGPHFSLGKSVYIETDLIFQVMGDMANQEDASYMSKLRVIGGWKIFDFISIYAGPTLNSFRSNSNDGSEYALWTIRENREGDTLTRISIGSVLGVKFFR